MSLITSTKEVLEEINDSPSETHIEDTLQSLGTSETEVYEAVALQDAEGRSIDLLGNHADLAFAFGVIVGARLNR
jgi:hypothetical protein